MSVFSPAAAWRHRQQRRGATFWSRCLRTRAGWELSRGLNHARVTRRCWPETGVADPIAVHEIRQSVVGASMTQASGTHRVVIGVLSVGGNLSCCARVCPAGVIWCLDMGSRGEVASGQVAITISVDPAEAAGMTYGQRERWLGKLAERKLAEVIPPRTSINGGSRQNRWKPYTRGQIEQAFREWAKRHDGEAPSKADWSIVRDPEGLWPRAASDSFLKAIKALAVEDGVSLERTSPCRENPEEQARRAWRAAQHATRLADGRLEATINTHGSSVELAERWVPSDFEVGLDPGPYCKECFHGSGCRGPEMWPWQYAVEVIGGLSLRSGGDFHATRSERSRFGRNRQMVTGGVFAAPDVVSLDAALSRYVS